MKNPQLENGYIRIATEIWEALTAYRLPGEQMQILMFIIRKTYGWNKKSDDISLSQFVDATKIKKPNVCRGLVNLCEKKIVIKKDNGNIINYRFNKKYNEWKPLSKKITLSKKIMGVIKKDNLALSKKIPTIDTSTIDTVTINNGNFLPPGGYQLKNNGDDWIDAENWDNFVEHRKEIKRPITKTAVKALLAFLKENKDDQKQIIQNSIMGGYPGLYPIKKQVEDQWDKLRKEFCNGEE
jgi:phage replication O-like protein O